MPLPIPLRLPIPLLPRKHGSLNHFLESPRESLENHRTRYLIDAGDSQVVKESPRESLFKDRYFVSGIDAATRFKDSAPVNELFHHFNYF